MNHASLLARSARVITAFTLVFTSVAAAPFVGAAAASAPPTVPPPANAPAGAATTYQIDAQHDGDSGASLHAPLTRAWSKDLGGAVSYPLVVGGRVFVTSADSNGYGTKLWALNAEDGSVLWGPVDVSGTYYISGIAADGTNVYVVNYDGVLQALSQTDGGPVWSVRLPGQYSFTSPPTVADGVVYVGGAGDGGTLYAVDAANGALNWTAPVMNGDHSSPAVGGNGVYVSYACGVAYRFDRTSGARDWVRTTGCEGGGGKTPVLHDGKLYVRDFQYQAILDAATGHEVGTFTSSTTPAFDGDVGYFLQNGTLRAIDTSTETTLWSQAGDGHLVTAPIVVGDDIAIGSSTGRVFLLDKATGHVDGMSDTGKPIQGPDEQNALVLAGLAAAGNMLFVPASDTLVAYRPSSENANFVTGLYRNFLGRTPDTAGLAYWVGRLAAGTSRATVVHAIGQSHEASRFLVEGLYESILDRHADTAGLNYWSATLDRTDDVDAIAISLYASDENFQAHGRFATVWVNGVYQGALGRTASASEQAYWAGQVARRGRGWVARYIVNSDEAHKHVIAQLYDELLGRPVDPSGEASFSAAYGRLGRRGIAAVIAASPEYFSHASQVD